MDTGRGTVIHLLPAKRWSAVAKYVLDICSSYRARGHRAIVLTRGARVIDSRFEAAGVRVRHAQIGGLASVSTMFALMQQLERIPEGPVVVHTHRYRDAMVAIMARHLTKRTDMRIVVTRHRVRKGRTSAVYRYIYRGVDRHVFVSALARDEFLKAWEKKEDVPFPLSRISVLHNSIYADDEVSQTEPSRGPMTAIFHGNIAHGKGVETVIDALSLIRKVKVRLKIVGTGSPDYIDSLRRRAMARGVMDLIDWQKSDTPMEFLTQAHFGVLPSLEREACGMSNIECMAAGRPQICTFNGAQPEYLTDGQDAMFVSPSDTSDLAEKMTQLATDPELRHRLGSNARHEYEKNLSWQVFSRAMTEIYGF